MPGRLFVCATPIGNLEDVTLRLLRILAEVDAVAAEDTRRTRKLLTHYGIHAHLVSYHEANEPSRTDALVDALRRVVAALQAMLEAFGPRRAAVARELTKVHEEVLRATLPELIDELQGEAVLGEVAIVVEGMPATAGDLTAAVAMARKLTTG